MVQPVPLAFHAHSPRPQSASEQPSTDDCCCMSCPRPGIPVGGWEGQWSLKNQLVNWTTLLGTNVSPPNCLLCVCWIISIRRLAIPFCHLSNLLLLSCPFQSIAYNPCAFKKSIYGSFILLYDVNLQGLYTARSVLFKAAVEKRNGMCGGRLVARFELVPICKEAESMIVFDVPLERCMEIPW